MTKKGIIGSIIGLVVLLVLLLGVLLAGIFSININFGKNEYKKVVFEQTYTDLKAINIDASYGNVYLKYSKDDKIRVEIASKKDYIDVTNKENNLTIKVKGPKCKFFCVGKKASRITIYLPKEYETKINVKLDLGDLNAVDFKKLSIDVENNMGDIKIDGVASLTGKNKMGDFKIKKIYEYVNIKNSMGDIKINNLTIKRNSNIKSNMGDIKIGKTNDIYIDAHVNMGDVKIKKNNRKAKYSLKIKNNMGDIKVNY